MTSIVELLDGRTIGSVEYVAADKISVQLHAEAPHATALNTGTPMGFPRLNSYIVIANEAGATVGLVVSLRIERMPYPKRKGMADFGLIDLPFPARLMLVIPIGTLIWGQAANEDPVFRVQRGVDVFPSVGDPVALPTAPQLRAIVEGEGAGAGGRIKIGVSPTAGHAPVYVDPNKLFGRHLAVLGNTGAGKSCTVAGLVRWSITAARAARTARPHPTRPNARFIVLDPNGEYAGAFGDLGVRVYGVEADPAAGVRQLILPAWLWNGDEWVAFSGAAPGVQRPILLEALRRLRAGGTGPNAAVMRAGNVVRRYHAHLKVQKSAGDHMAGGRREGVAEGLVNLSGDFVAAAGDLGEELASARAALQAAAELAGSTEVRRRQRPRDGGGHWHSQFSDVDIDAVIELLVAAADLLNVDLGATGPSADDPIPFDVDQLPDVVEGLAADNPGRDVGAFVDTLRLRIRALFAPGRLRAVACPDADVTLEDWLAEYVGAEEPVESPVTVIDLSLVPHDVVHVLVAVFSRMVFEALQRHRRRRGNDLPTVLVLEEAHTFIHGSQRSESATPAARACCHVLERIAREGRKFGLGLVVASQRPAELSETIVSQCNTFILHRLVNDRDQELVRRLVPDGLGDMLRELPSLPSRRAIVLGWATPAPILVEMNALPLEHRPKSPDPAFWEVWTGDPERGSRPLDWPAVAAGWAGGVFADRPPDDGDGGPEGGDEGAPPTGAGPANRGPGGPGPESGGAPGVDALAAEGGDDDCPF